MATRRSARLLAPKPTPAQAPVIAAPIFDAPIIAALPNAVVVATSRPIPPPIKPGVVTFLDLAGEIRNQIYSELLPDKTIQTAQNTKKLRLDRQQTSTAFMATCHQVYEEAVSILYPPTISETLIIRVKSSGTVSFLGRMSNLTNTKPANFSVLSRAKRLHMEIEVGRSLQSAAVCDVQDAMFNVARHLTGGHQLERIAVSISIGADPPAHRTWFNYDDFSDDDYWDIYGWPGRGNLGRMQEFRGIKPGDISRAHIAAFLTDPLRMMRGVKKNGSKYSTFSLDFPGKSGRPWRDLHGQVYDLILGDTAVPDYTIFSRYFDALRQMKRNFCSFSFKSKSKSDNGKEAYHKHVEELSQARIRGDLNKFNEAHLELLTTIDSRIALRIDFSAAKTYTLAEQWEHSCREIIYLKIELEAAFPIQNVDLSVRGYNIADAGLREWQTVGRKKEGDAKRKRKRKADRRALDEAVKKLKLAAEGDKPVEEIGAESD